MMGGRIWVTSEEGRGSQFHFVATFGIQPQPPRGIAAVRREPARSPGARGGRQRHEPHHPAGTARQLADGADGGRQRRGRARGADRGHRISSARSTWCSRDALMPDVDGFALARQIAADDASVATRRSSCSRRRESVAGSPRGRAGPARHRVAADEAGEAVGPARRDPHRVRRAGRPAARTTATSRRPRRAVDRRLNILVAEDNPTNQNARQAAARTARASRDDWCATGARQWRSRTQGRST